MTPGNALGSRFSAEFRKATWMSIAKQARYSDLFEKLLDCALLLEPRSYMVLEANPVCDRVIGVPQDKILGRSFLNWIEESERDLVGKVLRVVQRSYYPRQFNATMRLAGGKRMYADILACGLDLSDGNRAIQIIARDITFKREAEQKQQALLAELKAANEKLEVLSRIDEMTGLNNFRTFRERLDAEHDRVTRYPAPYSIIFCDVDHFKQYNDKNGHPAGDQLLKEIALILAGSVRKSDIVARYGGEEFAIICPAVLSAGAAVVAERIRSRVEAQTKVTISLGVAHYPNHGPGANAVVEAADQALYFSKKNGRNRVTLFENLDPNSVKKAA